MFLKFIRDFSLKKIVKKRIQNYKAVAATGKVTTVGVLLDETYFSNKQELIKQLISNGIAANAIETLSFKSRVAKGEVVDCCCYTRSDINNSGTFTKDEAAAFINKPFDLLISYYDVSTPPLVLATIESKALFKAGFVTTDNRLNNLMIKSQAENYVEFVAELFKYLKILNKI